MKYILLGFLISCAAGVSRKELEYGGESPKNLKGFGLVSGRILLPNDDYPHNNRTGIVYFKNLKTGQVDHNGETRGEILLKLEPGEYEVSDFWAGGMCLDDAPVMILGMQINTGEYLHQVRGKLEVDPKTSLKFTVKEGQETNIGKLLPTCLEWYTTEKMKQDYFTYLEDGKFEVFQVPSREKVKCGCKLLRK